LSFHPAGNNQRLNDAFTALQQSDFVSGLYDQQMKPVSFPLPIEPSSIYTYYGMLTLSVAVTFPYLISILRTEESLTGWIFYNLFSSSKLALDEVIGKSFVFYS